MARSMKVNSGWGIWEEQGGKENLFVCQADWNYSDKQFAQAVEMMKGE